MVRGLGRAPGRAARAPTTTPGSPACPQDLVLGDPGADDMFDDRVYKRGALTLHALRLELGDDAFFDLLRRWAKEHQHGAVTTEDFVALAEQLAGALARGAVRRCGSYERPLPPLTTAID